MRYSSSINNPQINIVFPKVIQFLMKICFSLILLWIMLFGFFFHKITNFEIDKNATTDAIIVLTGGKGRITEGLNLLVSGKSEKLLITGVGDNAHMNELKLLSKEMSPKVVDPIQDKITLGYMATDTKSNALEAKLWIQRNNINSIRLVTSNYHMPRSIILFKKQMPGLEIISHPVFSGNVRLNNWWRFQASARLIFVEFHKYLYSLCSSFVL